MIQPTVTPTGASGVWRVRLPNELKDTAVYEYVIRIAGAAPSTSRIVWRCEKHKGRVKCPHISAVQEVTR